MLVFKKTLCTHLMDEPKFIDQKLIFNGVSKIEKQRRHPTSIVKRTYWCKFHLKLTSVNLNWIGCCFYLLFLVTKFQVTFILSYLRTRRHIL